MDINKITLFLRQFAAERNWEQFHTPKNLVMALSGEAGELTELFQWLTAGESDAVMNEPASAERVRDEVADILLYCLRLADVLKIDVEAAVWSKLHKNAAKYPVHLARGTAAKYTDLPKE